VAPSGFNEAQAVAATVLERFPDILAVVLRSHGIADRIIGHEVAETAEQRLAKTHNRSVVGVMNELARLADWCRDPIPGPDDLTWLSLELAQTPSSPLYGRHVSRVRRRPPSAGPVDRRTVR